MSELADLLTEIALRGWCVTFRPAYRRDGVTLLLHRKDGDRLFSHSATVYQSLARTCAICLVTSELRRMAEEVLGPLPRMVKSGHENHAHGSVVDGGPLAPGLR